ncbi:MAG TPA: DUF924 family protein [Rhodoblastus sp.]|nr:DUF924 family protein [Rhodoblastus sp.]
MTSSPRDIIDFWLAAGPERWFSADPDFDALTRARFLALHETAARGDLPDWSATPEGTLALILLTDQFPRNMFRNTPRAFATDALAVRLAERSVARAFDRAYAPPLRRFFYLPFMHAEDIVLQKRCEALCAAAGDEEGVAFAVVHREIIAKFGRFPHRNPILGRAMTEEERAFLDAGGFSG